MTDQTKSNIAADVQATLRTLFRRGDVVEVRALRVPGRGKPFTVAGYFDSSEAAGKAVAELEKRKPGGIYVTLNEVNPALLARSPNRLADWPDQTTSDGDILRRRWLPIDFDAIRPSGISSTDAEHDAAIQVARDCREWLTAAGWPEPILADSGNGAHLLYRIDLPPDDDGLVGRALAAIAAKMSTPAVAVDTSVSNPSRIWRLYSTVARKGHPTADRPHRRSRMIDVPEALEVVPVESLEALGTPPATGLDIRSCFRGNGQAFNIEEFIRRHTLEVDQAKPWEGGRRWVFRHSPLCDHHDGAAFIVEHASGALTAGCHHASCSWTWQDLRGRFEPAAAEKPRSTPRAAAARPSAAGAKPQILLTTDEQAVADQAVEALAGIEGVYQRAGRLVHVVRDTAPPRGCKRPQDAPRVAGLALPTLRERLAGAVEWLRPAGDDLAAAHPPDWAVKAVAARGQWAGVKPLEGVTEVPLLRSDGTVLAAAGYDAETGLILEPAGPIEAVPDRPTADDLAAAVALLTDVVADFPFAGDDHRAAWFAGLLTPLCRHAFHGCAPLFLIDANCPGSGKGLLADCAAIIATGRTFARMSMPHQDDETRKRITSVALAGEPCILLDNVAGTLGGASLDAALTATTWSDRLLGTNETTGAVPLLVTWWATANNCGLGGDILRRLLHIRLETREERPEERVGFRYPDLLAYVAANRPKLTSAALTILRAYCAAGRPSMGLGPMGSFEAWSDLVRQAVVYAGLPDPASTRVALAETADTTGAALRAMLVHLASVDPDGHGLTAGEVHDLVKGDDPIHKPLREAIMELVPTRGKDPAVPTGRSIGMKFHHLRGRVVDGMYLERRPQQKGHTTVWRVQEAGN